MSKPLLADASLKVTKALPNGAASATTDPIDLASGSNGDFVAEAELLITVPDLGATPMPDGKTMKYSVVHSDNSDLSSPSTLAADVIIQTGASSAGASGTTTRFRFPTSVKRYVGVKATGSTTGDASGSSLTAQLVF